MKQSENKLHQSILDSLTPRERHTYFELIRLGATEETVHEELQVPIPQGSYIISYRELERLLDINRTTIRRALTRLVEKDLIELTNIGRIKGKDGTQYRTLCRIKHYHNPLVYQNETKRPPSLIESIYHLEVKHIANRLTELEALQKQIMGQISQSDQFMLDLILQSYHVAKNIITSNEKYLSVKEGLYDETGIKIFIQGETEHLSAIQLQLKVILTLLESLNLELKEPNGDQQERQAYLNTLHNICQSAERLYHSLVYTSSK